MQRGFLVGGNGLPDPSFVDLRAAVGRLLEDPLGVGRVRSPNPGIYPWQWLWDSCFHVLIWQALGEGGRAQRELAEVFRPQPRPGLSPT